MATWTDLAPGSGSPQFQVGGEAWDGSSRIIAHVVTGLLDNTPGKTYSYESADWTLLSPGTELLKHGAPGMAEGLSPGEILLFGGNTGLADAVDKTWGFDTTWADLAPSTTPPGRNQQAMIKTAAGVLMFGGYDSIIYLDDTWLYDGDWNDLAPATTPTERAGAGIALVGSDVYLFGGFNAGGRLNDLWRFDGSDWEELAPADPPAARYAMGFAYDGSTLIMFGGSGVSGNLDDAFECDVVGERWCECDTTPGSLLGGNTMLYDGTRAVILGGSGGGNETWSVTGTCCPPPPISASIHARFGLG